MEDLIYTKDNCPPCRYLKSFLDTRNIRIKTIHLSDTTISEFRKNKVQSTPTLITKEGKHIMGFGNISKYLSK